MASRRPQSESTHALPAHSLLDWACVIAIATLSFAAFAPALVAEFVDYDDQALIVAHAGHLRSASEALRWAFGTTEMGHWQPLTWLSWAFDYAASGVGPAAYHRTNLLLHAATAALLYWPVRRLFAASFAHARGLRLALVSALAVLAWSLHPLRVESVAWATERRDVLSGLFLVAALGAYLRAVTPKQVEVARGWHRFAIVCLVLSLLAKSWGMTFGVTLILLDVFPLRRLPADPRRWLAAENRAVLRQKLPYFVAGAAAAAIAYHAQASSPDTTRTLAQWGVVERITQACHGLVFYVAKTVWPVDLVAVRELPYHFDPLELRFVLSFVALAVAAVVLALLRKRAPGLVLAALVYAVTVAPVLGFAQSGPQLVADRYTYLSCIPWSIALAALAFSRRLARGTLLGAALVSSVVLGVLFFATRAQTRVWRDSPTLWEHAFACGVPSSIAHLNYGVWLAEHGRTQDALTSLQRAVEIRPDQGRAWFALGNLHKAGKRFEEAERAFKSATETMVPAFMAWSNLGNLYLEAPGHLDAAIAAYRAAVADAEHGHPKLFSARPYYLLGMALARRGEVDEARRWLTRAASDPELAELARQALARLE